MLCLLQSWRFQLSALPGQTMQRAQNTVDYLSHVFLQACTHLHQHKCKDVFKYPFVQRNRRCRSRQILGMEGFLPEFSQTYLKKTPKKVTSEKKLFMSFWAPFFSNQSMLGTIFAHIFRELVKVFRDFARIFTKSELLGGHLYPLHPRFLHQ